MAALYWTFVLLAGVACSNAELGTPTSVEEVPSIAQVESFKDVSRSWLQQCAASVLTSYHVLTAASCFSESDVTYTERNYRIRAGTSYRGTEGSVVEVLTVYKFPEFEISGPLGYDGDLAVVRLETPFELSDTIKQAAIIGEGIYLPDGLGLQLVGWGTTTEGGEESNDNLYSLDLYAINSDKCLETYYYAEVPQTITENMICSGLAVSEGRDLGDNDVGAPLFYTGVTVGVVSFGVASGNDTFPVVSTAIASYTQWIVDTARY